MALARERNPAAPGAMRFASAAKRTRPTVPLAPVAQLTATHFVENNSDRITFTFGAWRVHRALVWPSV